MQTPTSTAGNGNFLSALEALRSPANLTLVALAAILALAILALATACVAHGGPAVIFGLLLIVLACLVGEAGYCGVTLRRLQASRGQMPSGVAGSAVSGFFAAIKVLLAMLLLCVAVLLLMLVASLLFLVTQIPGIGPALNYLIFPIVALIVGVALYALLFIAAPLAAVAACSGRTVFGVVATVVLVVRSRLFDTVLRGVLLKLMALFVIALALTIVVMGVSVSGVLQHMVQIGHASGMSSYGDSNMSDAYGNAMGGMGSGVVGELAGLRSIGAASMVLYFLALSLGFVVYASGWVVIFNDTARDLDPAALEAQMRAQAERMQQKARAAQTRTAQLAREHARKSSDNTPPPGA
ncbi:MAG: hypothetical protein ABI178_16485 [Rhodanobacter sp.]